MKEFRRKKSLNNLVKLKNFKKVTFFAVESLKNFLSKMRVILCIQLQIDFLVFFIQKNLKVN